MQLNGVREVSSRKQGRIQSFIYPTILYQPSLWGEGLGYGQAGWSKWHWQVVRLGMGGALVDAH
jgi:hypothetical protein